MGGKLLPHSVDILIKYVSLPQNFSESITFYPKDAAQIREQNIKKKKNNSRHFEGQEQC